MRIPLDPSHLDAPLSVVVAIYATGASVAVAVWQWAGKLLAQIPTPDQVAGWHERDVYLCAAIGAVIGLVVMARWIATTLIGLVAKVLAVVSDNTRAMEKVGESIDAWTQKADGMVMPAFKHAMNEAFAADEEKAPGLACGKKR